MLSAWALHASIWAEDPRVWLLIYTQSDTHLGSIWVSFTSNLKNKKWHVLAALIPIEEKWVKQQQTCLPHKQTNKRVPSFLSICAGCSSDDNILPCTHVLLLIVLNRFKRGKNPTTLLSPTVQNVGVCTCTRRKGTILVSQGKKYNDRIIIFSFFVCL